MVDKQEKFAAAFEVFRLKDEKDNYTYFVHLTKKKGDLLAFTLLANAARAFFE